MKTPDAFQRVLRHAIEIRLPISLGLNAACGIVLRAPSSGPDFGPECYKMIAIVMPGIFHGFV